MMVLRARSTRRDAYAEQYFKIRRRRGVMLSAAVERLQQPEALALLAPLA